MSTNNSCTRGICNQTTLTPNAFYAAFARDLSANQLLPNRFYITFFSLSGEGCKILRQSSSSSSCTATICVQCSLFSAGPQPRPPLLRPSDHLRPVFRAGPYPCPLPMRIFASKVPCQTAIVRVQCSVPGLKFLRPMFLAGPRSSAATVPCRTSTARQKFCQTKRQKKQNPSIQPTHWSINHSIHPSIHPASKQAINHSIMRVGNPFGCKWSVEINLIDQISHAVQWMFRFTARAEKVRIWHKCYVYATDIGKQTQMWVPQDAVQNRIFPLSKIRIHAVRMKFWLPRTSRTAHVSSSKKNARGQMLNLPMRRQSSNMFC